MSTPTGIEWTDFTWNPFVGCSRVSDGCAHCYAIPQAARVESMRTAPQYQGTTKGHGPRANWTGVVNLSSESVLHKPDTLPPGSLVFVNSMSDFWHENAKDEWRARALQMMAAHPELGFQVLTKRPENILPMIERYGQNLTLNFWAGVTVENQKATSRIALLREVPAAIRFLSVEPLLDDVARSKAFDVSGMDWVIVGGESGPEARPMAADWVRRVRDVCAEKGVPFFFKQWGSWRNNPLAALHRSKGAVEALDDVGKGGSLLDGVRHREMPSMFWNAWAPLRTADAKSYQRPRSLPVVS